MLTYSTSMLRAPALALALLGLVLPSAVGNAQEHPKVEIVPNIPHALGVTSLAVSPDGADLLLSGSCDTSIKLWEVATGRLLRTFVGHAQAITAVAFSPDGRRLLSSSRDSALKLWDAASGKLILSWEGHRLAATAVAFSPDGTLLPSAGSDSIGRIDNTLRRTRGSFARLEDWCPPLSS